MSRLFTTTGAIVLNLFACTISAQEPTLAPEIVPPLLPAPPSTTAPEFIPQAPADPLSSAPLWTGESPPIIDAAPPSFVVPPSTDIHLPAYSPQPVVLYHRVRVRGEHKAHPLAVPTIVAVADPRDRSCLVHVEVCMPPCACEKVTHNRRGNRVTYDFGQYEIKIISRLGVVIVVYSA